MIRTTLNIVHNALADRLIRIKADASRSADDALVAAVLREVASRHGVDVNDDIRDDFAGGTSGPNYHMMNWRSHLDELLFCMNDMGDSQSARHLRRLADANSLKTPFTAADEANVIESIQEYLAEFRKTLPSSD